MRRRAKVDTTHPEIVAALRAVGAEVQSLAMVGRGCPDLLVGWRGDTYLLECKSSARDALTPDEAAWHARWAGLPVAVVTSPAEALAACGLAVADQTAERR